MNKFFAVILVFAYVGIFAQSDVIMDPSRDENLIDHTYPYNIEVKDSNDVLYSSTNLFANRKKPLVVLFWLTTCYPCRMEMEAITQKYAGWKKSYNFDMVAISTDFPENHQKFIDLVKQEKWPFPAYHDFRKEFRAVMPDGLNGLPQLFIFDKKGNIVYHKRKYIPGDEDMIVEKVKSL
jgi:cytochrome c biogenesis protein CcmG, thiol:disulfide interchange protein DsbE